MRFVGEPQRQISDWYLAANLKVRSLSGRPAHIMQLIVVDRGPHNGRRSSWLMQDEQQPSSTPTDGTVTPLAALGTAISRHLMQCVYNSGSDACQRKNKRCVVHRGLMSGLYHVPQGQNAITIRHERAFRHSDCPLVAVSHPCS